MKISVFGLGYVGCVSAGCLAQNGHRVTGVDVNPQKVDMINSGKPTIVEKDIDTIISKGYAEGRICATTEYNIAVVDTDITFICVGTPSLPTGHLNLEYVFTTARQIGEALRSKNSFHVIVIRSTVFPGTNEKISSIISEVSGKKPDDDFAVVSNPEFLREGSAVEDYFNPAVTVIGSGSEKAIILMEEIYRSINAPIIRTDVRVAEMIKYVNNAFHALKISFSNEVGNISNGMGIDSWKLMELFKMDTRLNISPVYLNPGMAYGGSCLPKDLRGLSTIAHDLYIETPVIDAVDRSNNLQKERVFNLVHKHNTRRIGIFGLAFKRGTDDLRYSPSVDLIESLLGKGYEVRIYDRWVTLSFLTGSNKAYIEQRLPHFANLLVDDIALLTGFADIIVVTHKPDSNEYEELKNFSGKMIDLVKLDSGMLKDSGIEGLSW